MIAKPVYRLKDYIEGTINVQNEIGERLLNPSLLGPCNYYCGNCILYKKAKCFGCTESTAKAQAEGRVFCDVAVCARESKIVTCSECKQFPCEKYNNAIFAESFIKFIKDKLKEA